MVKKIEFKGMNAIKIENEFISIVIIPSLGGKIVSILHKKKDFELLFQNKSNNYKIPELYSNFTEYDASGFDDAFPNIDECKIKYMDKEIIYPDHGEIWSSNFDYKIIEEKVILKYKSKLVEYIYEKEIDLTDNYVNIKYNIENIGEEDIPCIWTMHCLINCEENMKFIFPKDTKEVLNVINSRYLGKKGTIHKFPLTKDYFGNMYHLDRALPSSSKNQEKYYVNGKVKEGKCAVYYPNKDINVEINFEEDKLPYLGLWITEGGFRGDYNCAFEPSSGFYDSIDIAIKEKSLYLLKKYKPLNFTINILIS